MTLEMPWSSAQYACSRKAPAILHAPPAGGSGSVGGRGAWPQPLPPSCSSIASERSLLLFRSPQAAKQRRCGWLGRCCRPVPCRGSPLPFFNYSLLQRTIATGGSASTCATGCRRCRRCRRRRRRRRADVHSSPSHRPLRTQQHRRQQISSGSSMAAPITGKTVVVVGGSRGIGAEFVRQFVGKGNRVLAACRWGAQH